MEDSKSIKMMNARKPFLQNDKMLRNVSKSSDLPKKGLPLADTVRSPLIGDLYVPSSRKDFS